MDFTMSVTALESFLDTVKASDLDLAVAKLFQNDVGVTPRSVKTEFDVATFTGYASVTLTAWGATFIDASNRAVSAAPNALFQTAAPFTIANQIYGFWVENAGGDLLFAHRFDEAPIAMAILGNSILLQLKYAMGN